MEQTPAHYSRVAVWLHWLVAALILAQFAIGFSMVEIPRNTPARGTWYNVHKSIGLVAAALIFLRLGWRLRHPAPLLPSGVPAWQARAARVNHVLLYACMLTMPVSGYVASNFTRFGVTAFGVHLPPWGPNNPAVYGAFNGIHVATAFIFVALAALHVAAGIRHLLGHDGIFRRIWF